MQCCEMFWNYTKCCKFLLILTKGCNMLCNIAKWSKMFQYVVKCFIVISSGSSVEIKPNWCSFSGAISVLRTLFKWILGKKTSNFPQRWPTHISRCGMSLRPGYNRPPNCTKNFHCHQTENGNHFFSTEWKKKPGFVLWLFFQQPSTKDSVCLHSQKLNKQA